MSIKESRTVAIVLVALAMLYGLWDLVPAITVQTKPVYQYEYKGGDSLRNVIVVATLVCPPDSAGVLPYDTNSKVTYGYNMVVWDTSGVNGKWLLRLPLTSNISPAGCRWHLRAVWRNEVRFTDKYITTVDTTTQCLKAVLGEGTCP